MHLQEPFIQNFKESCMFWFATGNCFAASNEAYVQNAWQHCVRTIILGSETGRLPLLGDVSRAIVCMLDDASADPEFAMFDTAMICDGDAGALTNITSGCDPSTFTILCLISLILTNFLWLWKIHWLIWYLNSNTEISLLINWRWTICSNFWLWRNWNI